MTDLDEQVQLLMGLGRVDEARALVATHEPQGAGEDWLRRYWTLRLTSPTSDDPAWQLDLDSMYVRMRMLAGIEGTATAAAARAWRVATGLHVARRLRDLADRDLANAEALHPWDGLAAAARVRFHLAFDERDRALAIAQDALPEHDCAELRLAFATLLYTVGAFDGALEQIDHVTTEQLALHAHELRAAVHASQGDLAAQLTAVSDAVALNPDPRVLAGLHLRRAHVHAELDQLDDARQDFEMALEVAPPQLLETVGEYVRRRLDALDVATDATARRRLEAFPSVVQRWNYCGPAVLELCLRYAGEPMSQDLIADAVKHGEGTSPLAMVEFLREHGFEARRIEATPEVLRRAIDLGVPVILEDHRSTSGHVTVAIGYDDRLGTITVADPMTHAPLPQGIEARAALAADHRYAGIAVLGRTGSLTTTELGAAQAAGLVEREALTLIDQVARRDRSDIPVFASTTALEAAGLAEQALALEPDFPLAAMLFAGNALSAAPRNPAVFGPALARARLDHPGLGAISRMTAAWNLREGRTPLAIIEAAMAVREDPEDAAAHSVLGSALADQGQWPESFDALTRAIALEPHRPEPTLVLAMLVRSERAARVPDADPAARVLGVLGSAAEPRSRLDRLDDDQLDAMLAHLLECAAAMAPEDATIMLARGDAAVMSGDAHGALDHYRAASEAAPGWDAPATRRLLALERIGDDAATTAEALALISSAWPESETWATVVTTLLRIGDADSAATVARRALDSVGDPVALLPLWFEALAASTGSAPRAAHAMADHVRGHRHRPDLLHATIDVLFDRRMTRHAVELLEQLLADDPANANAAYRLATLLGASPGRRGRAVELLEGVCGAAPWASGPRADLAWLLLSTDPSRSLALAESLPGQGVMTLELRRLALVALADRGAAFALRQEQERLVGSPLKVRLVVAMQHLSARRYDLLAEVEIDAEPPLTAPDEVAHWCTVLASTGRADEAVAFLTRHEPELRTPMVAASVLELERAAPADLLAWAFEVGAADSSDATTIAHLSARALGARGHWEQAEAQAGPLAGTLAALAERAPTAQERVRLAHRAQGIAPHDRAVLAALHGASLDAGDADAAWETARELAVEYEYEHDGLERLAECESLLGDPGRAVTLAQEAYDTDRTCWRAVQALALAHAMAGDWGAAGAAARTSLGFGRGPSERACVVAVIAAATSCDEEEMEREIRTLRTDAPGGLYEPLIEAARAQVVALTNGPPAPPGR